jgi:hypothetical protein
VLNFPHPGKPDATPHLPSAMRTISVDPPIITADAPGVAGAFLVGSDWRTATERACRISVVRDDVDAKRTWPMSTQSEPGGMPSLPMHRDRECAWSQAVSELSLIIRYVDLASMCR